MSSLLCRNLRLEEASAKSQVTDKVKKLVSCAFVRESEDEIAEVTVFTHLQRRYIEKLAHTVDLLISHRMLDNDNRIVHIPALHEVVVEKEFDLMEENKSPANSDLLCIYHIIVPYGILNTENL